MQLSDYQWSRNPRGMHNVGSYSPLDYGRITPLQLGWYKLVSGGEEFAPDCARLLSMNITPVIRIYRASEGPAPVDDTRRNQWRTLAGAGAKWFEFYNELNLPDPEWPGNDRNNITYQNVDHVIKPICENWIIFAEYIIGLGGYPGFPALSETSGDNGAVHWMEALLTYMHDHLYDRFLNVANNGAWCATHPYTLNHFYQETPGQPAVPRDPTLYNGTEGGWHFEYPNDPYTQSFDPGRSVFGSPSAPGGDPNGITAMGIVFNQKLQEMFGVGPLPVVGTEGGIYPLPINEGQQTDPRYPGYDRTSHAEATVAMFNWIATTGPNWLWGITLWKEDMYFDNHLPAIDRMEQVQQIPFGGVLPNTVPTKPTALPHGPGPVHGDPTFHMVVLAPGLDVNWFFDTAQSYWNTFRPIVTTVWDFINFIPYDRSLAVTLITPPDVAGNIISVIKGQYPNIVLDLLMTSDPTTIANTLNARVASNRRLG